MNAPLFLWEQYLRLFTGFRHSGPVQPHFDGRKFANLDPIKPWSLAVYKWLLTRKGQPWPQWIEASPGPTPPSRISSDDLRVTFINHATVLIQTAGLNIITDPVLSPRVGPFFWLGSKRVRRPGLDFDQIPKIDLILISHDHYDHMDRPTIHKLVNRDQPQIISGLGVDKTLKHNGIKNAQTLDWWQSLDFNSEVKITFTPSQHFSGRGLLDQDSTLWGSFVISCPYGNIYFAGDSGYNKHYQMVQKRFHKIDFAILPIGAYEPRWFMKSYHMSPQDAVKAHVDLNSQFSMGIHFGTFRLSDEGYDDPKTELQESLAAPEIANKNFITLEFGDSIQLNSENSEFANSASRTSV